MHGLCVCAGVRACMQAEKKNQKKERKERGGVRMNRRMERKGVEAREQEEIRIVPMCVACLQARN